MSLHWLADLIVIATTKWEKILWIFDILKKNKKPKYHNIYISEGSLHIRSCGYSHQNQPCSQNKWRSIVLWCTATCRIRNNTTFEIIYIFISSNLWWKIDIMRSPLNVFTRRDKCNDTFKLKQYIWLTGHILSLYDSSDGAYNCFQSSPLWAVVVLPFLQQVLTAAEVGVFKEHPGPL